MPPAQETLSSGIPQLDTLLAGGLPQRELLVVAGRPGTGKTVLVSQIAFGLARRGLPVVLATVGGEPHTKLLQSLEGFAFYDKDRVGKELFILSAYPWVRKGAKETRDMLLSSVRERKARLLVIDGLRGVRALWPDETQLREFFSELAVGLATSDCTGLFTVEDPRDEVLKHAEGTMADGVLALSVAERGTQRARRLEVVKLRGRGHVPGEHSMRLDATGVSLFPRLESLPAAPARGPSARQRAAFGIPALDELVSGGLPEGSSTVLLGGSGTGKSLLAAHFAAEGARRGEPCVYLSFQELPSALVERAAGVGLELEGLVKRGLLHVLHRSPVELDADQVAQELLEQVRTMGARRLVVDPLFELERAVREEGRTRDFLSALRASLDALRVTTVCTAETTHPAGVQLDWGQTAAGAFAENLILLSGQEQRGRLLRQLQVLKMRASAHSWEVRAYQLSGRGFALLPGEARAQPAGGAA